MIDLKSIYDVLFYTYGTQGWWPLICMQGHPGFDLRGYHPGLYQFPETEQQRWEILCGTILTQNTTWTNAERALQSLLRLGIISPQEILTVSTKELATLIKSSGYYNQKAERIKKLAHFIISSQNTIPARDVLLKLKGVGPETADSMLLYAWHQPHFVVDAYTIRLFTRIGLINKSQLPFDSQAKYQYVQNFILAHCNDFADNKISFYSEFHSLIVMHAKQHCSAIAECTSCPLAKHCNKVI